MSVVTNWIFSVYDPDYELGLQEFGKSGDGPYLERFFDWVRKNTEETFLPQSASDFFNVLYGVGSKCMEASVYVCATNYFGSQALLELLKKNPEAAFRFRFVQILSQEEDGSCFLARWPPAFVSPPPWRRPAYCKSCFEGWPCGKCDLCS